MPNNRTPKGQANDLERRRQLRAKSHSARAAKHWSDQVPEQPVAKGMSTKNSPDAGKHLALETPNDVWTPIGSWDNRMNEDQSS